MSRPERPRVKPLTSDWADGTPLLHRALASNDPMAPAPVAPVPGDDLMVAASYWTSLLQILVFSFGWTDPALGRLGISRQSRQTGIWFSGKHRYHRLGSRLASEQHDAQREQS